MVAKRTEGRAMKMTALAASKVLRDPKSSLAAKSAAASSLVQSPAKPPKLATARKIRDAVRKFYSKAG